MQRQYDVIDVVAALGVFATIVAGTTLFLAANGTLSLSRTPEQASAQATRMDGMQWLQPVLGQALVDQFLLERRHTLAAVAATNQLSGLTGEQRRWQLAPLGYLDSMKRSAARAEEDHETRVQTVMGRSIVNFTRRGIHGDVLSPDGDVGDFNPRMIKGTEAFGQRIDAEFDSNWQPNLGRAILSATQEDTRAFAQRQERLGAAIVQVSTVTTAYERGRSANQEQLGGAIVVALQADAQTIFSDRDRLGHPPVATLQRESPGLPVSTMVVAHSF